jgi:phytoene dehydrogenase-like protein
MKRIGIVGGGPGGLFTAYLLQELLGSAVDISIFEASARLGGKVLTEEFSITGSTFEAGVAELYDYSHYGPDPLKLLVKKLGLMTLPMAGPAVIMGNTVIADAGDIEHRLGGKSAAAVADFYRECEELCSPASYSMTAAKTTTPIPGLTFLCARSWIGFPMKLPVAMSKLQYTVM